MKHQFISTHTLSTSLSDPDIVQYRHISLSFMLSYHFFLFCSVSKLEGGKRVDMMTAHNLSRISAAEVKNADPGKHADGGGLWLVKQKSGSAQWVLRVTVHGRRREMGLGSYPSLSMKDARESAAKWRTLAAQEMDPIKQRQKERREAARICLF